MIRVKKQMNKVISPGHENTPTKYTTRSNHPRAPPPPTHHPPTKPHHSSTTAVEQYVPTNPQRHHSSTAVRTTAVHLWYARSWVGFSCNSLRFSTFRGRARAVTHQHPPSTTYPPTNPPPPQYNSSGVIRTDQFTAAAQQYGSTHHSGTPVVRQELGGIYLHFVTVLHLAGKSASRYPPSTHHPPPTQGPTHTTAVQQQWSSTYRPIHSGSTAVRQYSPQRYTCGPPGARSWVRFAFSYDSPLSGGEREPSPGEAFHAPRSRSWDSSAVVLPGISRADVWGGRGTGVRSLGAGWRAVEHRVVSVLF